MAYYADVAYVAEFSPEQVRANSAEFLRVRDLINSVLPTLDTADRMEWRGTAPVAYSEKLREARQFMSEIGGAFGAGADILDDYANGIGAAGDLLGRGQAAEAQLREVLASQLVAVSVAAADSGAEPLRWWDELQGSPDLGLVSPRHREQAQTLYDQAQRLYDQVRDLADRERDNAVARLASLREGLPRYEVSEALSADSVRYALPRFALDTEVNQARSDPDTRPVPVPAGQVPVSPELAALRERAAPFPDVQVPDVTGDDFVRTHAGTINAAAQHYGVSPEAVATILRHELTGTPQLVNEATEWYRQITPGDSLFPGDRNPDTTSYGAGQIQIRRAAEVLGYDPSTLTDAQRDEIRNSLNDAEQNIFITAGHLAQLQDSSTQVAGIPPSSWSDEDYEELFRLYNDGPGGEPSEDALGYARERATEREHARQLLDGN